MAQTRTYRAVGRPVRTRNTATFLTQANGVVTGTAAYPGLFSGLAVLMAVVVANLAILADKQKAATAPTKTRADLDDRRTALDQCTRDMEKVLHAVQPIADAAGADAAAVLAKAGFLVKKRPTRDPAPFRLDHGVNGGELRAVIRSPGPAKARTIAFQCSNDGGKTWGKEVSGPERIYLFEGLTVGVAHLVRYRVKLMNKPWTNWSDPLTLMVK